MIRKKLLISITLLVLLLSSAPAAFAAAGTLSISGAGDKYVVQGTGFTGIAGVKFTVTYDTTTLANPRVTLGSLMAGAFIESNTTTRPGYIIVALALYDRGVTGSGPVVSITFDRLGGSPVKTPTVAINELVADADVKQVMDSSQQEQQQQQQQQQELQQQQQQQQQQELQQQQQQQQPTGATTWLGGVTMPSESGLKEEKKKEEAPSTPPEAEPTREEPATVAAATEAAQEGGETQKPAATSEKKSVAYKSVLERFHEFKEEKTPKSLIALFDTEPVPGIRQEPEIALSDGKAKVRLFIELPVAGKEAPNFALKGAKLVSLKIEGKAWVVEALPNKEVNEATVTVLQGDNLTEIPLIVVQPMDKNPVKAGAFDEASFVLFLKERGTEKAPRFDLNGDGKRDYIDDYIYAANYIIKNGLKKKQKDEPKVKPKDDKKTTGQEDKVKTKQKDDAKPEQKDDKKVKQKDMPVKPEK